MLCLAIGLRTNELAHARESHMNDTKMFWIDTPLDLSMGCEKRTVTAPIDTPEVPLYFLQQQNAKIREQ